MRKTCGDYLIRTRTASQKRIADRLWLASQISYIYIESIALINAQSKARARMFNIRHDRQSGIEYNIRLCHQCVRAHISPCNQIQYNPMLKYTARAPRKVLRRVPVRTYVREAENIEKVLSVCQKHFGITSKTNNPTPHAQRAHRAKIADAHNAD